MARHGFQIRGYNGMTFISTKTYGHEVGLSVCFRQHKAKSHCRHLHGYALAIRLEFECDELDENNWCIDFGSLRLLKEQLELMFDHKMLVAEDDPEIERLLDFNKRDICRVRVVQATGCEAFAKLVHDVADLWLTENKHKPRVRMRSVEVREHGANSAIYVDNNKGVS